MQQISDETVTVRSSRSATYYRGFMFARIEDFGPDISYNETNLEEGQALALAVQAFTLMGVGTGSRKSGSWLGHMFGPFPVPTGQLTNMLMYPFLVDAEDSKDPRVKAAGRSCAFMFLVSRQMRHYDQARDYLEQYLAKWVSQHSLTPENLKQLGNWVSQLPHLEPQVDAERREEEASGVRSSDDYKRVIRSQSEKILLLEHLAGMDNLTKALITLYESNPEGGTVDQLARIAGMGKRLTSWNLRKFAKAGVLQVEDERIMFLQPEDK